MDAQPLERLICFRRFPPVVHPRHARELVAGGEGVAEWTGGYAITVSEHRQMLEELLGSLAWHEHGQAALINGLYGTGKSHLLVLLHLLAALPGAWEPFLDAHPAFRRYAEPMKGHRRLILHFSLDEYGPRTALEEAVGQEAARALAAAGLEMPDEWQSGSRLDAWAGLLETCRAGGYDGIVLLLDELSLFLAGRSPAKREADAAFLQFLAGWTARAPVWLIGALQRNLADVGALRTHSWRQVEDRFRRYSLSPQEIGGVLREKLIVRADPAAVRALVAERIVPAAAEVALPAGELQACWPFHPRALELFMALADGHLSPHRSAVEVLQRLDSAEWRERPADRLITPLDLFSLVADELRGQPRLERFWSVVTLLEGRAELTPDPALARRTIGLLAFLHLAERTAFVEGLRALLFDGRGAPPVENLSEVLHALRRRGAHLAAVRDADPGRETFCLAIDDEVGVLADLRMQEMRQEFTPDDPRVVELAWDACREAEWPLAPALDGGRIGVPWSGSERQVLLATAPALVPEAIARACEGLAAGKADGCVILGWPGAVPAADIWHAATAALTGTETGVLHFWQPRPLHPAERELFTEYAAWARVASAPLPPATPREKRVRERCAERAAELREAVAAAMRGLFVDGRWTDGRGEEGEPRGETLAECLAGALAAGFAARYPHFPALAAGGAPSRAALQQLLLHFVEPGEIHLDPQSLLGEYLDRYALPLGCAEILGAEARLVPPRWEVLEPLLALAAERPARVDDAVALLERPPLGLTAEQARLAVFAAARAGALQPLDAFLQPLDPEAVPIARSDAVAFLAPPATVEARFRLLVLELAAIWEIAAEPWATACSQVERRLRGWLRTWTPRVPEMRAALEEWSETFGAQPWGWEASLRALAALDGLGALPSPTLDALLSALEESGLRPAAPEALWTATSWWQTNRARLRLLPGLPLEGTLKEQADSLRHALAEGEACFPQLDRLGEALDRCWADYREAYRCWHDAAFGTDTIAALREAFDSPEFRAVKQLSRLPLPLPEPARDCLEALARARAGYCPGFFVGLDAEGCCTKCRLPLGAPSPMPDPAAVRQQAEQSLSVYADLLKTDPWTATLHPRLPRAPQDIAPRAAALLAWQPTAGAPELLDLLDERLINWLCREDSPAAHRRLDGLGARLHGRDLTLAEARETVTDWLDPEHALGEEEVLRFE
jgi:hypothetical protein